MSFGFKELVEGYVNWIEVEEEVAFGVFVFSDRGRRWGIVICYFCGV